MLLIVWSLSLFVDKSAKKLIVFVIAFAKNGLALEAVPVCLPSRGQSRVFLLLERCSLRDNTAVRVPSNSQVELQPFAAWDQMRRCQQVMLQGGTRACPGVSLTFMHSSAFALKIEVFWPGGSVKPWLLLECLVLHGRGRNEKPYAQFLLLLAHSSGESAEPSWSVCIPVGTL